MPRGVPRQNLCFMCYKPGHVISDCPQLPGEVREQAAHNRALYYNTSPTPQVDLKVTPTPGLGTTPIARKSYTAAVVASTPSDVAVIEEDPHNLPRRKGPRGTDHYGGDRQSRLKKLSGGGACRGDCHPLFGLK
jgi:hypothetical protein